MAPGGERQCCSAPPGPLPFQWDCSRKGQNLRVDRRARAEWRGGAAESRVVDLAEEFPRISKYQLPVSRAARCFETTPALPMFAKPANSNKETVRPRLRPRQQERHKAEAPSLSSPPPGTPSSPRIEPAIYRGSGG